MHRSGDRAEGSGFRVQGLGYDGLAFHQFAEQLVDFFFRHVPMHRIVDQHRRGDVAQAKTFGELQRHAAVGRGLAGLDAQPFHQLREKFLAAACRAANRTANPHAIRPSGLSCLKKP